MTLSRDALSCRWEIGGRERVVRSRRGNVLFATLSSNASNIAEAMCASAIGVRREKGRKWWSTTDTNYTMSFRMLNSDAFHFFQLSLAMHGILSVIVPPPLDNAAKKAALNPKMSSTRAPLIWVIQTSHPGCEPCLVCKPWHLVGQMFLR